MTDLLTTFQDRTPAIVDLLARLVEHESPSDDKAMVDRLITFIHDAAQVRGASSLRRFPTQDVGDCLLAKWNESAPGKPILFLCHADTVHPAGTLAGHPVRQDDGRLYGPGALDMKAGIALALEVIEGLRARGDLPARPIWLLVTSDEEIGSGTSEPIIVETAQQAGLVLTMEPAAPGEALKIARKAVMTYRLDIEGRASHAGNAPEQGLNAIIEFAQQAMRIHALNDYQRGTSLSVTQVQGGTASNVIPAHVTALIDGRCLTLAAASAIRAFMTQLTPFIPGCHVKVTPLHERPPLEFNAQMQRDFEQVKAVGERVGVTVRGESVGGGSDGSITAAHGIPTLDGLGPAGDGMHATHEHVLISSLARRAALAAGILQQWDMR
jgi:glutamate carboxypeptidase